MGFLCLTCARLVADNATRCPHCGHEYIPHEPTIFVDKSRTLVDCPACSATINLINDEVHTGTKCFCGYSIPPIYIRAPLTKKRKILNIVFFLVLILIIGILNSKYINYLIQQYGQWKVASYMCLPIIILIIIVTKKDNKAQLTEHEYSEKAKKILNYRVDPGQ